MFDATLILVVILTLVQAPVLPWAAGRLGVASGVSPSELEVESAPLDSDERVLLGFEIPAGSRLAGLYISDLSLPAGAVVSLVVRDGEGIVPDLHTRLRVGDQLLVVATDEVQTGRHPTAARGLRAGPACRVAGRSDPAPWRGSPESAQARYARPIRSETISADSPTSGSPPPGCTDPPDQEQPGTADRLAGRRRSAARPWLAVP